MYFRWNLFIFIRYLCNVFYLLKTLWNLKKTLKCKKGVTRIKKSKRKTFLHLCLDLRDMLKRKTSWRDIVLVNKSSVKPRELPHETSDYRNIVDQTEQRQRCRTETRPSHWRRRETQRNLHTTTPPNSGPPTTHTRSDTNSQTFFVSSKYRQNMRQLLEKREYCKN